jgi:hypothetical protein
MSSIALLGWCVSKKKLTTSFGEEKFHLIMCPPDILENSKEKDW